MVEATFSGEKFVSMQKILAKGSAGSPATDDMEFNPEQPAQIGWDGAVEDGIVFLQGEFQGKTPHTGMGREYFNTRLAYDDHVEAFCLSNFQKTEREYEGYASEDAMDFTEYRIDQG